MTKLVLPLMFDTLSHNSSAEIIENLTKIAKSKKCKNLQNQWWSTPVIIFAASSMAAFLPRDKTLAQREIWERRDWKIGPETKYQNMIEQAPTYQAQSIQALYYHLKH